MLRIFMLLFSMSFIVMVHAGTYSYNFRSTPLPQSLMQIMESHPEIEINFIFDELENYTTSAVVDTDNAYDAIRQTIGLNPVTVVKVKNTYYVEALQHGKYIYTGRVIGVGNEILKGATVMLLSDRDSTVITYGITDDDGRFTIPCDYRNVVAKLSCLGYKTTYRKCDSFDLGTIIMAGHAVILGEVKVEAISQYMDDDKSVFVPSRRVKNSAHDAASLLMRMAIPQLYVNPINNSITMADGREISKFVNYQPASEEDLSDMRPQDVKRVEVYVSPRDPRFEGARHVVNFIMVRYEYGGYSKFSGREILTGGDTYTDLKGSSKFTYKKMTYDLSAGFVNTHNEHLGTESETAYDFDDKTVTRHITPDEASWDANIGYATLRAFYASDNTTISNTLGFRGEFKDKYRRNFTTLYDPDIYPESEDKRNNDGRSYSGSWNGRYQFLLPDSWSLTVTPTAKVAHYESKYLFSSSVDDIINNAQENNWKSTLSVYSQKTLGRHSVGMSINGELQGNHIVYTGTNPATVDYDAQSVGIFMNGNLRFGKCWISPSVKFYYERAGFSELHHRNWLPGYFVAAGWNINSKNQLSFSSEMYNVTTSVGQRTPNIVVQNLLDAVKGNPEIDSYPVNTADITYEFMPNQKFSMMAYVKGLFASRPFDYLYTPVEIDGREMMLANYSRYGNSKQFHYILSSSLKLLSNSLYLNGQVRASSFIRHGIHDYSRTDVNFNMSAYYYLDNLYFGLYYQTPQRTTWIRGISKSPSYYNVTVGWSKNSLNVSLTSECPFRSDWKGDMTIRNYGNYRSREIVYGDNYHRNFTLRVSYSFSYGKKIKQGDEVGSIYGPASGIVK